MFTFREFDLGDENGCPSGALWYHDGNNVEMTHEELCGKGLPKLARSRGNVAIFQLFSKDWNGKGIFRMEYAAVNISTDIVYPLIGAGKEST